jgi:CheY-like chemotaxis protein
MSLADQLLQQITDPTITHNERVHLRCQLSKELEESGDYEGAREAMDELWSQIGERPALDGLDQEATAEVLLRAGVLTSCIGSAKQIEGAQETAKNLISESIAIFETLQQVEKAAEAQTDLAYCYWRQGAFDEARVLLQEVLSRLADKDSEVKAIALIRSAIVERSAKRYYEALRIHIDAAPLFEKSMNHAIKGKFHVGFAIVLRNLGTAEGRDDYIDRALIEYVAASYHFEQAGHERFCARVENNLGILFSTIGKFTEAHEHVERARRIFVKLKDSGSVAQVDETRARVLLAEGRNDEAEKVAGAAVQALEKGGEQSLLAEALTTHGITLARTGQHERARLILQRAVEVAYQAGDPESAGQAALIVVEELADHLSIDDLGNSYDRAAELLTNSQHPGIQRRLTSSARRVIRLLAAQLSSSSLRTGELNAPFNWEGFSFKEEIRRHERLLIERALKDAGGVVSRAAQLLGFKHHQSLISLLGNRHKDLLHARTPVLPRRRSLLQTGHNISQQATESAARPVKILHVEDNEAVANALRDTLEWEGWKVEICADGMTALKKIAGNAHYDLLIFDNDLPGVSGLELVLQARSRAHRRRTPIIMLSASDCEAEAWRAGVDAFLRKPENILIVADTVARLLNVKTR